MSKRNYDVLDAKRIPANRNAEALASFTRYCREHPQEIFWQALRNWSNYSETIAQRDEDAKLDAIYMEYRSRLAEKASWLSGRERDVLREILSGKSNAQAARSLGISQNAISCYRGTLYRKLGISHAGELFSMIETVRRLAGLEGKEDCRAILAKTPVLTSRQADVLREVLAGKTYKEIASKLGIAYGTVSFHRRRFCEKLGVTNIRGLLTVAQSAKLLTRPIGKLFAGLEYQRRFQKDGRG
jgi:DNA-binding CsgD family transcriptional regulator